MNPPDLLCHTSRRQHTNALTPPRGALRVSGGCTIDPEPITAADAALRLRKDPATIRSWGSRYQARKLGRHDRRTYYDYNDLATIDGCIARGEDVPETAELRDQLRAALRERFRAAA
ncbi:hypothetical protein [Nonomuraea roseoviolacea]|uniref:MerR family transcriptional regulator n=1 Tax=Nonomuraea roseoviolacea subsp. carminata TaxID=160689 RepID=A0ABT1KAC8_9ACTN|nr:hypothetical protein [Nonomuraea roseoviolacea]MCP2350637.1 hypothetical protein [Nonomuraea roseoviolacea subsp. carminata]